MATFEEVSEAVDGCVDLITLTPEGLAASRERASQFLYVQAMLTSYLKEIDEELAKKTTLKEATFASVVSKVDGKSITEKKINVAKSEEYSSVRESLEELDALREWIKGHIKIFENAHILYRGFSRE
jgi:hypothetical protein